MGPLDGDKSSMNAEQREEQGAFSPLLAYGNQDELLRHQPQAEHCWKADEANEAKHLAKDLTIASDVVSYLCQSGLGNARHHSVDCARCLVVPTSGGRVDAGRVFAEELAEQDGEGMQVADVHDVRQHQLAAEAEHLPSRREERKE